MEEKESIPSTADAILLSDDEYGDADIFDDINIDIDNFSNQRRATSTATTDYPQMKQKTVEAEIQFAEPVQFPNGKWECRHKCADKTT